MADTPNNAENAAYLAASLGRLLADHGAKDVRVLDMRLLGLWTDFFVIVTSSSAAHQDALYRHIKEAAPGLGGSIIHRAGTAKPRTSGGSERDEWKAVDMGDVVVHIMSGKARAFYDLERLWSDAPVTEVRAPAAG